jgi:hypothetical protein
MNRFIVFCFFALFFTFISASYSFVSSEAFWDEIYRSQSFCADLACEKSSVKKRPIKTSEWIKISPEVRAELRKIARTLVNENWPESILEGDFIIKGHTRLDEVYFLMKNNESIGYWISYSVRAWDVSTCDYDPIEHRDLSDCREGRIYEGAFVHSSLKDYNVDRYFSAHFKPL